MKLQFWKYGITVLVIALGSFVIVIHGQDEYMTCSRPIKASRNSRQQNFAPCNGMENGIESYCILPGPEYPWHAVRRFVFENQGLMRRMYGEVRQLSVLRMEFSGDSNNLDESRDFDDLFKPFNTFEPASPYTLTNFFSTTESIPTLVVTSDPVKDDALGPNNNESNNSTSSGESIAGGNDGNSNPNPNSEEFPTTIDFTTTEETGSDASMEKEIGNPGGAATILVVSGSESLNSGVGVGITDEPVPGTTFPEPIEPLSIVPLSTSAPTVVNTTTTTATAESTSTTVVPEKVVEAEPLNDESDGSNDKVRLEGQLLFQDLERARWPSTAGAPPTTTTTTEEPIVRTQNRVGVNACPVKEEVVAPYWANNTRGEVLALLNLYPFEQYIHWEKCTNENRQMYCRDGCRCEQQYRLHRLLAFDPHNECRGIFSDWFRFPSCCVCKCYFDTNSPERVSFNRSPRIMIEENENEDQHGRNHVYGRSHFNHESTNLNHLDLDGPDVNGVDDSHFFYKYSSTFRQPRKK